MKPILTKIYVLSLLCALPALANDVGLYNNSAQPTRDALVTPQPNWISDDHSSFKLLKENIKNSERYEVVNPKTYTKNGPLGIPALTIQQELDYIMESDSPSQLRPMLHDLRLAFNACYSLDILAKQAGAWGPECKITKFINLPKGKLSEATWPDAREGDYMYSPPHVGTDTVRFILENGAGKKVDVTFKIRVNKPV